jgi:predicted metal-binding protein
MYTVLHSVLKQKCGLEFEREYSAILEGYMYVYYVFVHGTKLCTQCTVRWPGAGAGGYATNAVEYGTDI